MFKCDNCNENSKTGESQKKVVIETTSIIHRKTKLIENTENEYEVVGTFPGTQIVKEENYCTKCYNELGDTSDVKFLA